jgi:hypothetical protein
MVKDRKIGNAMKRSDEHRKDKRGKEQDKLKRRMATKKAEQGENGAELKRVSSGLHSPLLNCPKRRQTETDEIATIGKERSDYFG